MGFRPALLQDDGLLTKCICQDKSFWNFIPLFLSFLHWIQIVIGNKKLAVNRNKLRSP